MEVETQTLRETAEQALIGLIQSVTDAAAFLKGEIPAAVQELLTYYTAMAAVQIVALLGFSVLVVVGFRPVYAATQKGWDRDEDMPCFARVAYTILGGGGIVAMVSVAVFCALPELLKITLAPRIWLIEYAASLVK